MSREDCQEGYACSADFFENDEDAHQLSYLQRHLGNILSLLTEPVDGDEETLGTIFLALTSTISNALVLKNLKCLAIGEIEIAFLNLSWQNMKIHTKFLFNNVIEYF